MKVNELTTTIMGEYGPWHQGEPIQLLRLQGCNLNCSYCDATAARNYNGRYGTNFNSDTLIDILKKNEQRKILITGGEPLLQLNEDPSILYELKAEGFDIAIETNGSLDPEFMPIDFNWIVDYKLPGSGMQSKMLPAQETKYFPFTRTWWKFVISDMNDYEISKNVMWSLKSLGFHYFGFSPVLRKDNDVGLAKDIFEMMIMDKLYYPNVNAVLSVQIHKLIGMQ